MFDGRAHRPLIGLPGRIGDIEVSNRIFMAPMTRARGTREHVPTGLLSGYADDTSITSNRKLPNPNVTVFEWLAKQLEDDHAREAHRAVFVLRRKWRPRRSLF